VFGKVNSDLVKGFEGSFAGNPEEQKKESSKCWEYAWQARSSGSTIPR